MSLFSNDYIVPIQQYVFWNSVGSMGAAFLTSLKVSNFTGGEKFENRGMSKKEGSSIKGADLPLCHYYIILTIIPWWFHITIRIETFKTS